MSEPKAEIGNSRACSSGNDQVRDGRHLMKQETAFTFWHWNTVHGSADARLAERDARWPTAYVTADAWTVPVFLCR